MGIMRLAETPLFIKPSLSSSKIMEVSPYRTKLASPHQPPYPQSWENRLEHFVAPSNVFPIEE